MMTALYIICLIYFPSCCVCHNLERERAGEGEGEWSTRQVGRCVCVITRGCIKTGCLAVSCSVASNSLQSYGCQAPLSMGFSRQEYWTRLPFAFQEIFLTQELNPSHQPCRNTLYLLRREHKSQSFKIPLAVSFLLVTW